MKYFASKGLFIREVSNNTYVIEDVLGNSSSPFTSSEEDLDTITVQNLYEYYQKMLQECKIDLFVSGDIENVNEIVEQNENIKKYSYGLNEMYVILEQNGILLKGIEFDAEIAAYILNPSNNHYKLEELASQYLNIDISEYLEFFSGIKI